MNRLDLLLEEDEDFKAPVKYGKTAFLHQATMKLTCGTCRTTMTRTFHVIDCQRRTYHTCPKCGGSWPPMSRVTFLASLDRDP